MDARANVVSSFTIVKGSLIEETYAVLRDRDYALSKLENLKRVREENTIGATSTNWALNVAKVLNRRFEPGGRDRPPRSPPESHHETSAPPPSPHETTLRAGCEQHQP